MRWLPLALLPLLLLASPAAAAPPVDPELETVLKVNRAVDGGVTYLRRHWNKDTHWESFAINALTEMNGGVTALATLALLNSGVRTNDEIVSKPLDYLRRLPPSKTYVVALVNLCLAEARDPNDLPRLKANAEWLIKTARRDGKRIVGWSYPFSDNQLERADASNTQYALLGLYAAKTAGVKIADEDWKAIQKLYLDTQISETKDTGSWSYIEKDKKGSFTMTTAGVCGLLIARMGLDESGQGLDPTSGVAKECGKYPENEAVRKGMNWIGEKFAFRLKGSDTSTFYNVYGIERVGRLSGQRFIGRSDWYRDGCEFLLKEQKPGGEWSSAEEEGAFDSGSLKGVNVISTAFSLLFLSKGRSPVLISKLAHGESKLENKILVERNAPGGVIDWNRKHNDARNLTDFASRELFKNLPLGWQTYDPRRRDLSREADLLAEAGVLVQSPILYITGHAAPNLSGEQQNLLKKYLEEGGFVIAEACCGSQEFQDGFRNLIGRLFKGNELKKVPPEHALWSSHFLVPPTEFSKLECLDVGCRTVLVFSPEPLAGYWEEGKYMPAAGKAAANRGEKAFHLAANVIAYATGKEPPKQRLAVKKLVESTDPKTPPRGFIEPVQVKLDEAPPAGGAMRNLMGHLREVARLDVSTKTRVMNPATEDDIFKFKFLYMHGKKGFTVEESGLSNLRDNLQSGGLLLADACCGSKAFDDSFRAFAGKLFPDRKADELLVDIPADDPLYSAKLNGAKIDVVERREKAGNAKEGNDAGYERLPPKLEGIKIDGRWVVIYSKYDIGCALERHKSTECLGHTPESALKLASAAVLYSLKR